MIKLIVFAIAALVIILGANCFGVGEKLRNLKGFIDGLGFWGPLVFIVIYTAATVALLPGSVMTLIAGGLFGAVEGTIIVSIASTSTAAISFLLGRYLLRGAVTDWLGDNPKFQKLDRMTEKLGSVMVAITRLVPLFPFTLLNYGFGLTKVKFRTYIFWSWLCMLPGTVLYVVAGAGAADTVQGEVPWLKIIVIVVDLVLITIAGNIAREKIKAAEEK
jgi:uncharacterized membrane protein YdjX (TVP38/TMEM64 family)